ncbi:MAG TPA: NAD(P)-dependent alcohol dehydrogenase [Acidisarcina sp.]|nr:NAD(P)-dependent alcohol dehydrogenase [Acidisarcina sp.]
MKAWRIGTFGVEQLEQVEIAMPVPGPRDVLVRIHAVSLNFRDLLMVKGLYNPKMALPRIPCSDGAGEIVEVGSEVQGWKVGDRVAGIFMQNWLDGNLTAAKSRGALGGDIDGMLAEYVALPAEGVVAVPAHLTYGEAATLPCAAVTAWNAVNRAHQVRAGETVVIQGTGGVSLFALQFARLLGARVIGTSSSDEKLARARKLDLDAGLNYRKQSDWASWVLEQTGGEGADLIVEVGGAGTLQQSLKAVRFAGTIAQIGILTGNEEKLPIGPMLHKQIRIQAISVGSRQDFLDMNRAISHSKLKPAIGNVFSFNSIKEALATMEGGSHFGKIVIRITD